MPLAGGRSLAVDIEQYARTFPDSYFDPKRSSEPRDFGGVSLQQRAGNACNSVQMPLAGGRSLAVDIEQYARTFPDSYFDPKRSS
ncbi:hypothetical protein C7E18_23015, partial [Stenotrophomonas maltophilia]